MERQHLPLVVELCAWMSDRLMMAMTLTSVVDLIAVAAREVQAVACTFAYAGMYPAHNACKEKVAAVGPSRIARKDAAILLLIYLK